MSRIADYLSELIKKLILEKGVVIWYDPDAFYGTLLPEIALADYPLFRYQGSFFALRLEIEWLLAAEKRPAALIYVPLDRSVTRYALIEAECAGGYVEPGHPQRNLDTRLEQIARNILEPIHPDQVDTIVQRIRNGELGLADVDRLAESGYAAPTASLSLVYDKADPLEICYEFLTRPDLDDKLREKNAGRDLSQLAAKHLGYAKDDSSDLAQMRQKIMQWLLFNDFLIAFPEGAVPARIRHIAPAAHELEWKNCVLLMEMLRQRHPAREFYHAAAKELERKLPLAEMELDTDTLLKAQTFPSLESLLLQLVLKDLLEERMAEAETVLAAAGNRYWAQEPPWNLQWNWLTIMLQLWTGMEEIAQCLKHPSSPADLVTAYCNAERPWHLVDRQFHEMETRFQALEADAADLPDLYERLLVNTRKRYSQIVRIQAQVFQQAMVKNGCQVEGLLRQRDLFDARISPLLEKYKTAFIQADALRYDLAARVIEMLPPFIQAQLEPALGQLPGITAIGMAAGLPGASGPAGLSESKRSSIGFQIGTQSLHTRQDRQRYLESYVGAERFTAVDLEAIQKPRKAVRDAINRSRFIWVSCQEIDAVAENLSPSLARSAIESLLSDLRRGILRLFELGMERIVMVADHGFLFGEEAAPGERIDAPGGQTASLHRRVWIGRGGSSHPACLRLSEKELGLDGSLELIFPAATSIFKSPGGNLCFFHGGISLQEMVVPVMTLAMTKVTQSTISRSNITMTLEKQTITNRVFLVRIKYQTSDLFAPERVTLRLVLQSNNKSAGRVLLATPQHENKGHEIIIERGQEVTITCALDEGTAPAALDLLLYDFDTEVLVTDVKAIKIDLLN